MGQFDNAIKELQKGNNVIVKPRGNSMRGKISSGDSVTLKPCDPYKLLPGDIVLVKVKGRIYLHLVKAMKGAGKNLKIQIGNNKGHINGWTNCNSIYGKAIEVDGKVL